MDGGGWAEYDNAKRRIDALTTMLKQICNIDVVSDEAHLTEDEELELYRSARCKAEVLLEKRWC